MIAQKTSLAFFSSIFQRALGFLSLFYVSHYMGPKALGTITYATAYIGMFAAFSDLGFGTAHVKRISEGKDLGKCNGTFLTIKLFLTLLMAIVVGASIHLFQEKSVTREEFAVLYIMLGYTVISNLATVIVSTFAARRETAKEEIPKLFISAVTVAGKVLVAVMGFSIVYLAGVDFLGVIILLVILILLFKKYPIEKPDCKYFRSYATYAVPIMVIGFLMSISLNIDKVIIKYFLDATNVGYYSAAQSISLFLTLISGAGMMLTFSKISLFHSEGNIEAIRKLTQRAERYTSIILWPAFFFILVFSEPLCRIVLGNGFILTPSILIILSGAAVISGITLPYSQQPAATNRMLLQTKISIIPLGLNVILDFLLVPKRFLGLVLPGMGAIGAALAALISVGVGSIIFRYYAYKISKSNFNWRILLHMVSGATMGMILYTMSIFIGVICFYHLVILAAFGTFISIVILTVLGEFGKDDFKLFVYVLNPVEMRRYIINEMKGMT